MELPCNNRLVEKHHFSAITPVLNSNAEKKDALAVEVQVNKRIPSPNSEFLGAAKLMLTATEKWDAQYSHLASGNADNLDSLVLSRHRVEKNTKNLADTVLALPKAYDQIIESEKPDMLAEIQKNAEGALGDRSKKGKVADDAPVAAKYDTSSSREICADLAKAIGDMSTDYLDVFQQAVEKNAAFYQDFSDFMSRLKEFIEASDDKTILKAKAFRAELDALINKYPVPGQKTTLFPVQGDGTLKGGKKEDCLAWAKEMGLNPENSVKQLGDGTFVVVIDVSPLQKIKNSVPDQDKMECNSAQWAAWQAGVDMQKDTIQTGMQTLTQKYSNANSTFDNLVKILSSTISSLLECDKAFFNI